VSPPPPPSDRGWGSVARLTCEKKEGGLEMGDLRASRARGEFRFFYLAEGDAIGERGDLGSVDYSESRLRPYKEYHPMPSQTPS